MLFRLYLEWCVEIWIFFFFDDIFFLTGTKKLDLEEEMATHSNILAWRIPWPEEPDGPQSMGSERIGHD